MEKILNVFKEMLKIVKNSKLQINVQSVCQAMVYISMEVLVIVIQIKVEMETAFNMLLIQNKMQNIILANHAIEDMLLISVLLIKKINVYLSIIVLKDMLLVDKIIVYNVKIMIILMMTKLKL